jgi:hypothetical protein
MNQFIEDATVISSGDPNGGIASGQQNSRLAIRGTKMVFEVRIPFDSGRPAVARFFVHLLTNLEQLCRLGVRDVDRYRDDVIHNDPQRGSFASWGLLRTVSRSKNDLHSDIVCVLDKSQSALLG